MFLNLDFTTSKSPSIQVSSFSPASLTDTQLTTRQEEDVRDKNKTALFYYGY